MTHVHLDGVCVHVCSPATFDVRSVRYCPTCKARRRFVGSDAVWYGVTWTCCACGDSWSDGERLPRPVKRGWRKVAAIQASRKWPSASRIGSPEWRGWLADQLGWDDDGEQLA